MGEAKSVEAPIGTEYLTCGQMAQLNCVSPRALHIYQRKGILEPRRIDPSSGYRYYTIDQCSTLDTILELQTIGLSLDEIQQVIADESLDQLEGVVRRHRDQLLQRQRELSVSLKVAEEFLTSCERLVNRPECDIIRIETLPERRALVFDVPEQDPNGPQPLCVQWEPIRKLIKQEICARDLPISLYRNVGRMITADRLERRDLRFNKAYVFVDESFGDLFDQAEIVRGGEYLTLYSEHCVNVELGHVDTERALIADMIDYAEREGYVIDGDYIDDVVAETPAFQFEGRDAFFRLCLPVRKA